MDSMLEKLAVHFLLHIFLECVAWEDKSRCKLMYQLQKASKAVSIPAVSA